MMPALQDLGPVILKDTYELVRPLAVGGMAEVFLARQHKEQGVTKEVVIKRLKPALAEDPRVVSMFQDEARVTALLNHANVVHVYDSGTEDGVPFIVMEYIRGDELNVLCRRGISRGEFLPLEQAIGLVRQAAMGMGYYHNRVDANGRDLELVHCDISPNNLLVGQDGYLQIIDFGIGQFRGQSYRDDKLVPGKLSYMSPEQARREPMDRRSDIFSLGIVLYEITLGKRLFRGNAREVLPRLIHCEIKAPTFIRHDYPGALESIVMRCLEPEPSDRYQEAYDLADALGEYLREEEMRGCALGVARYVDRVAVLEGANRREELIPESEADADVDELDFDRGLFSGFQPMEKDPVKGAASWEEIEEDEQAVADALGIDVRFVRTSSRAGGESELPISLGQTNPSPTPNPSHPTDDSLVTSQQSKAGSGRMMALFVVGLLLGFGSAFLLGVMGL